MGNVKYSLKQFNKTRERKEPDVSPPGSASTGEPAAASTSFGMLNTLQAAGEETHARRRHVMNHNW